MPWGSAPPLPFSAPLCCVTNPWKRQQKGSPRRRNGIDDDDDAADDGSICSSRCGGGWVVCAASIEEEESAWAAAQDLAVRRPHLLSPHWPLGVPDLGLSEASVCGSPRNEFGQIKSISAFKDVHSNTGIFGIIYQFNGH